MRLDEKFHRTLLKNIPSLCCALKQWYREDFEDLPLSDLLLFKLSTLVMCFEEKNYVLYNGKLLFAKPTKQI